MLIPSRVLEERSFNDLCNARKGVGLSSIEAGLRDVLLPPERVLITRVPATQR
jgi:hypothetical protein